MNEDFGIASGEGVDGLEQRKPGVSKGQPFFSFQKIQGFGFLSEQEEVGRIFDNGSACTGSVEIIDRLRQRNRGTPVFSESAIAGFDKCRRIALGQKIPGFIDDDDLFLLSITLKHGFLNRENQEEKHHFLKVSSPFEFFQFEDVKGRIKLDDLCA